MQYREMVMELDPIWHSKANSHVQARFLKQASMHVLIEAMQTFEGSNRQPVSFERRRLGGLPHRFAPARCGISTDGWRHPKLNELDP